MITALSYEHIRSEIDFIIDRQKDNYFKLSELQANKEEISARGILLDTEDNNKITDK